MLVNTTLVRALYFSALLVTAWPQLWKATSAIGASTFQVTSSFPDFGPNVTMTAAPTQSAIWTANEAHSTQRRFGEKKR